MDSQQGCAEDHRQDTPPCWSTLAARFGQVPGIQVRLGQDSLSLFKQNTCHPKLLKAGTELHNILNLTNPDLLFAWQASCVRIGQELTQHLSVCES